MDFSANHFLVFLAVISIQGLSAARIPRSTDGSTTLQDLMDNARTQFQSVAEEFNRVVTSSNLEQMTPILLNQTAELRSRVETLSGELRRQLDAHGSDMSDKTSAAIVEAIGRLNSSLDNLQSQGPAAIEGAEAIQQRFNQDFKSTADIVFEELGKVAKASSQDTTNAQADLNQLSRNAMSRTMNVIQQLQNQFQQAVSRGRS